MSGVVGQDQWTPCRRYRIRSAWGVKGKRVAAKKCKEGPDGGPCLQCTLNMRQSDGNFKYTCFFERLLPYQQASVLGNIVIMIDQVTGKSVYSSASVIDQTLVCNYLYACGQLHLVEPPLCYIPKPSFLSRAMKHDQCVINDSLVRYQDSAQVVTIIQFPTIYDNTGLKLIVIPREEYKITTSLHQYTERAINNDLFHWLRTYRHLRIKGGKETARIKEWIETARVKEIKFSPEGGISLI